MLKSFPTEVQGIFNDVGVVKTEIRDGNPHIFTYHDESTEKIGKKLNRIGYIYKWYYDVVNEEKSVLVGWFEIRKLI